MSGEWMERAECRGMNAELFYPSRGGSRRGVDSDTWQAKQTCAACPVRVDCLKHAIATGETQGVWGGTSPRERRALRRAA